MRLAEDYDDLVRTLVERIDEGIARAATREEHLRWVATRAAAEELAAGEDGVVDRT